MDRMKLFGAVVFAGWLALAGAYAYTQTPPSPMATPATQPGLAPASQP